MQSLIYIRIPFYKAVNFFVILSVFLLSLLIAPYYISGDQLAYRNVYESLSGLNLVEGFVFYSIQLDSREFIHFLLSWLASNFHLDKDVFFAFCNSILAYLSMSLFEKYKASVFVAIGIVLTNFYLVGLYFAAERLKIAFIFLFASMLYVGQPKRFFGLALLAIFSHVEVLLVYGSIVFVRGAKSIWRIICTGKIKKTGWIIIPVALVPMYLMSGQIYSKFLVYSSAASEKDLLDLGRIFLIFTLSLWYSKNKSETALLFFPMIVAVALVGGDRVNMLGYFVFLHYGVQYKRGLNLGILATSVYFAFASFQFIENILKYGDGFSFG